MASHETWHCRHAQLIALVAAFALGLGACGQTSTETAGRNIDNDVADASSTKSTSGGTTIEDAALRLKVRSALAAEPEFKATTIDVDVSDGAVKLYGTAHTPAHREKAAQVALNVEGVRSVANHVILLKGS